MKTTGVSDIPKFGLLDFLGHPIGYHGLVSKTDNLKLNHFLTFDMPRLRTISTALKAFSQLWNK